jgi:hypothetical protein
MKSNLARAIFTKGGITNIIAKSGWFSAPTSFKFHSFISWNLSKDAFLFIHNTVF